MGKNYNSSRLVNGLYVDSNGNVGINTTSTPERLSINGSIKIDTGTADGGQLVLASSGYSDWNIDNYSGTLRAYYGATTRFSLTNAGAATFSSSVTAVGTTIRNPSTDGSTPLIEIRDNSNTYQIGYLNFNQSTDMMTLMNKQAYSGSGIAFGTNNTERVRITQAGNVGIGTTSPSNTLHILGTSDQQLKIDVASGGTYSSINFARANVNVGAIAYNHTNNIWQLPYSANSNDVVTIYAGAAERMRITSGGKVLVGLTSSSGGGTGDRVIETAGNIYSAGSQAGYFWENRSSSSTFAGWYTTSATIYLYQSSIGNIASINYTTGIYTPVSDVNKKKDFEDSTIGLNAILGLKPTLYRMKGEDENTPKTLGFIAQEVKEFIPQAYSESDDFIGLSDRPIIAALVKAIQEQQAIIDELKADIELLKNK